MTILLLINHLQLQDFAEIGLESLEKIYILLQILKKIFILRKE